MDSSRFPFFLGEQSHQFHADFPPWGNYPDWYQTSLWKLQISLGHIPKGGCPDGQHYLGVDMSAIEVSNMKLAVTFEAFFGKSAANAEPPICKSCTFPDAPVCKTMADPKQCEGLAPLCPCACVCCQSGIAPPAWCNRYLSGNTTHLLSVQEGEV